MKGFLLIVLLWITAAILTQVSGWTLFEAFVIAALSYLCIEMIEGAAH